MAGDIVLGIRLTADGKGLVGEVRLSSKEIGKLGGATKQAAAEARQLNSASQATSLGLKQLRAAAASLLAAFGVRQLVRVGDTYSLVASRLKLVTESGEDLERVQRALSRTASDTRIAFEATANLYARVARGAEELGLSQRQLLTLTTAVNQSILVSGASAQESSAGVIQFSQALASGRLQGDELRSVLEQLPRLARAIADGLGVSVGELRKLGSEGALTARQIADALIREAPKLAAEFEQIEATVGQAFTVLGNELGGLVSDVGEATGVFDGLAAAIIGVAEAVRSLRGADVDPVAATRSFAEQRAGELEAQARALSLTAPGIASSFAQAADEMNRIAAGITLARREALSFQREAQDSRLIFGAEPPVPGRKPEEVIKRGLRDRRREEAKAEREAIRGARQAEREREQALDLLADLQRAQLEVFENEIGLIEMTRRARLAAIEEAALSEAEAAQARALVNRTAAKEIAEARDEERESLRSLSDESKVLTDSLEIGLNEALAGNIRSWEDFGRVALRVIGNIITETARLKAGQEGGGGGGNVGGLVSGIISLIGAATAGGSSGNTIAQGDTTGAGGAGFSFVEFGGPRAGGGRVTAGKAFLVGEAGPEPFIPDSNGTVLPNGALGANVTINIVEEPGVGVEVAGRRQDSQGNVELMLRAVRRDLMRDARDAGEVTQALSRSLNVGLRPAGV